MLSKNDLQQIKEIIKTEVHSAIHTEVRPIVREEAQNIVQEELVPIKKDLRAVKTRLNRVAKDVRYIARDFDERLVANTKEIEKLKN